MFTILLPHFLGYFWGISTDGYAGVVDEFFGVVLMLLPQKSAACVRHKLEFFEEGSRYPLSRGTALSHTYIHFPPV